VSDDERGQKYERKEGGERGNARLYQRGGIIDEEGEGKGGKQKNKGGSLVRKKKVVPIGGEKLCIVRRTGHFCAGERENS